MRYGKNDFSSYTRGIEKEWLIANGRSGFAGTTIIGANSRKYHSLLNACVKSPDERYNILPKLEETMVVKGYEYPLTTTRFENCVVEGYRNLQSFSYDGIPCYKYFVKGAFVEKRVTMEYGKNTTVIEYNVRTSNNDITLNFNPYLSFKNPGQAGKEENIKFERTVLERGFVLKPELKKDITINLFATEGSISKDEERITENVHYDVDERTGDVFLENFYVPGQISVTIPKENSKRFYIIATIEEDLNIDPKVVFEKSEARIKELQAPFKDDNRVIAKYLPITGDHFIVDRDSTKCKTILAGYPWFLDWGRDTMIAFPGLVLATGRFEEAREILRSFTYYEKNGLIPNMFPDNGAEPLYNTVDASLWYIHCIYMYLVYSNNDGDMDFVKKELYETAKNIIKAYKEGTDFSIKMEDNYLISAGSGLDQVTWMDVRVNGIVVTPRHGCPVEINALWYNALRIMTLLANKFEDKCYDEYKELSTMVKESFVKEFWYEEGEYLYDVVNSENKDTDLRPNQIWAVSLPFTMLDSEKEKKVVNKVLEELYTPYGLRSLEEGHKDYNSNYIGELLKRDMAYHQGTTWSFPLGGFLTAYYKVNGANNEAREFVDSLLMDMENHIKDDCLGGIAEILDGDSPHTPRGCYSQAWGVGEMLRVYYECILGNDKKIEKVHNKLF
ncbi:MAG: amylo-alpha-1,6-glucosidase [Clostridium sp.]